MPAIVSHYLLAERVYNYLCERYPKLDINHNAFIWGASGPDILFCHRFMPYHKERSLHPYGLKLHNVPAAKMLNYLAAYSRSKQDDIAMSYTLGFVTHYVFDSIAHPFILYSAEVCAYIHTEKSASTWHHELESVLDTLFLRREQNKLISRFPLQSAAPIDPVVNDSIAGLMQGYLLYEFGKGFYKSEIIKAQHDWHFSLAALNDPTGIKHSIVKTSEKLIGLRPMLSPVFRIDFPSVEGDPANMKHIPWFHEQELSEHTESFFDLVDRSESRSLELITKLLSRTPLTDSDCPHTFSGHRRAAVADSEHAPLRSLTFSGADIHERSTGAASS